MVHAVGSSFSASIGFVGPRYLIHPVGMFYLLIFIVGIIFLAFDVRARDERERMLEVLDSRPYSNFELVLGRFTGLFITVWAPLVIFSLIIQALGWLLPLVGSPIGETIEPFSLLFFQIFIAVPAIAFACSLVMFITLLVRHQFIALVLSVSMIAGFYFLSLRTLPYAISSSLDLLGFYQVNFPSDWGPSISASYSGLLQRAGVFVLSISFLFFAALVHPRLDGRNRRFQMVSAIVISVVGLLLLAKVYDIRLNEIEKRESWRIAHDKMKGQAFPDITSMQGMVNITPGSTLEAKLELAFKAPKDRQLTKALFSLNPGYEITQVSNSQGTPLTINYQQGLLEITLESPLAPGEQTSIKIHFNGKPDNAFAYLDSAIDHRNLKFNEADVTLLGIENAIFDDNYLALMPGIHWLPTSGVDVGRDDNPDRSQDFFSLQLKVRLPKGWLAAGPGLRIEHEPINEYVDYSFSPQSAISEVALLASHFKRYTMEVENITFEILLHPDHIDNIQYLAEGKSQIKQWIADNISSSELIGLEYPFRAFTLIEVPNTLRGYKGGWRMGTSLTPPSMLLMKETGLPTARFDFDVVETFGEGRPLKDESQGAGKVIQSRLHDFFVNDFTGGNLYAGVAESYFSHQTAAIGSDAVALDYALNQLTTLVLSRQRSYFSVARVANLGETIESIFANDDKSATTVSERVINSISSDPKVWESALIAPLNAFEPWQDPGTAVDRLALKAGGAAMMIYDILGPEKSGQLLVAILNEHRGDNYTRQDVVAAVDSLSPALGMLIEDLFTGTGLAGFTSEKVELYQLPENSNGDSQFQLKTRIRNDETVTGYIRVSWTLEEGSVRFYSAPILIAGHSAVEFGLILSQPPVEIYIDPYLSLNRKNFLVRRFDVNDIKSKNLEPFKGVQEIPWAPPSDNRIIVDDLDPQFSIIKSASDEQSVNEIDQGLTLVKHRVFPNEWSQLSEKTSWGKYRHTLAFIRAGEGNKKAIFGTDLPNSGRWKLELHLPQNWLPREKELGSWELNIVSDNKRELVHFDTAAGLEGWNLVGEYELPAGDVKVEFSNKTNGQGVIADAIAWSPVH